MNSAIERATLTCSVYHHNHLPALPRMGRNVPEWILRARKWL